MFSDGHSFSNSNSFDPKGEAIVRSYPLWFWPHGVNPKVTGL
jgi:hypothetical protein